jgi:hypothetical protein
MPGFDFSNHNRNAALHAKGMPLPKATSTGTTIVGCLYNGGVVIAADTRATSGPIVADKVTFSIQPQPFLALPLPNQIHLVMYTEKDTELTDLHRTAKNSTTSHPRSGARARALLPIPNSPPP